MLYTGNIGGQITPLRIHLVNKSIFPFALVMLDLLLSDYGLFNIREHLKNAAPRPSACSPIRLERLFVTPTYNTLLDLLVMKYTYPPFSIVYHP